MRELRGIECARCRKAGHRCQAQIWVENIPLCLRCADGEPCFFVTASKFAEPVPAEADPCEIPEPTREDRKAIREWPRLPSMRPDPKNDGHRKIGPELRAAIIADCHRLSAAQIARKYYIPKSIVVNIRSNHRARIRTQTPVPTQIGGEDVIIAPAAIFGAEMLKAREEESSKKKFE
jgi:hypothetical protein